MADAETALEVQVLATEGPLFQGQAIAVSATNATGPFAILPQHANFVSVITGQVFIHESRNNAREIDINQGVIYCQDNQIKIFAGVVTGPTPSPAVAASPSPSSSSSDS